jgi:ABC-type multidrug transport system fused ATPase/permease subunit
MDFWENFWDVIWWFFWCFVFVSYLFALFGVIADLFRDRFLSGWWKAVWIFFLIFVPFLTVLIYLIARGRSMAERSQEAARAQATATEAYIRQTAGTSASPADEIAKAQDLLDRQLIRPDEFEKIKAKALA